MLKTGFALFAMIAVMLFGATAGDASGATSERLKIVTTIFPAYDFARAVAGERADVSMLVRPGSEVHTFDPSPRDIISIHNADVFICIGGESESWVNSLLKSPELSDKTVLRLIDHAATVKDESEKHEHEHGHEHEHEHGHEDEHEDEHIWTSPRNAATLVTAVADALSEADPTNASEYRSRANDYGKEINALGEEFKALVASGKRKKIVFGDRFPFRCFTDEFGLEYIAALPGCSAESDVSVATMAYLVKHVKDESIPVVYTLELSAGKIANAISEQTGAQVLTLHSCQNVTKSEFDSGATYVTIMRQNLESLRKGLH